MDATITLAKNVANCYIVAPGTVGFEVPVIKAFKGWRSDAELKPSVSGINLSTGALSANLLWQDRVGLISSVSLQDASLREGAKIRFNTANASGNAVIELKVGGVTRWSWHIWVTDYDPNAATGQKVNLQDEKRFIFVRRNQSVPICFHSLPGNLIR